ncbi:hypothetical protein FHT36_000769 [Xanthobacter sp. SG618]|uniref:hypothetical protein n=1 Tax=Xanthobacter sp. SG618 TaxID=2587121 RepID=UPI00145EB04B|nr:hypothetical protein [Xanthobacter sp. SG618]NMN56891.1 hypothetical protein [Xanthobacter sp. SG618]
MVFGVGYCAQVTKTPEQKAQEYLRDLKFSACYVVQEKARSLLKAPSTAKFDSCTTGAIVAKVKDKDEFIVIGDVDAQNSFGAMLRSKYSGTAVHTGTEPDRGWQVKVMIVDR